MNGIQSTVNMDHIKKHYYGCHTHINPFGIIPVGSNIDFATKHDRGRDYASFKRQKH